MNSIAVSCTRDSLIRVFVSWDLILETAIHVSTTLGIAEDFVDSDGAQPSLFFVLAYELRGYDSVNLTKFEIGLFDLPLWRQACFIE